MCGDHARTRTHTHACTLKKDPGSRILEGVHVSYDTGTGHTALPQDPRVCEV